MNWKRCRRKWYWPNLRLFRHQCGEAEENTTGPQWGHGTLYLKDTRNTAPVIKSWPIVRVLFVHLVLYVSKRAFIFISLSSIPFAFLYVFVCPFLTGCSVSSQTLRSAIAIACTLWDVCWLYFVHHTVTQFRHNNSLHPGQEIKAPLRHK